MKRYCVSREAPPQIDDQTGSASRGQCLIARPPGGRLASRLKDARGSNIVEMALALPLLLLLTFSIVDFAAIFYVHLALENGVSQAARYGVTGNTLAGKTREESIREAMRGATPTLTIDDTAFAFSHLVPGSVTWLPGTGEPGDVSRVQVTHNWQLMTPVVRDFFASNMISIKVESAMLNEPRFD
jgi:Flp pilus assembly protein TadG